MSKRCNKTLLAIALLCIGITKAQEEIDTTRFSKKYYHMQSVFESLPNGKKEIVFLGNSITEQGRWSELFNNKHIVNRGIGGDRTDGVLFRLTEVISSKPKKIFLMIGINDVRYGRSVKYIVDKNRQIIKRIKKESPNTKIYLQSLLPTYGRKERPIKTIEAINQGFISIAHQENITYINLFPHFIDETGALDKKYSLDGLHLNGLGYLKWKAQIKAFVKK
jgi:lysophospholipase L1-like esterase